MADGLVVDVYRETRAMPADERFGLTAQIRRAAVSVTANIVEGSARSSSRDYAHFLAIALGSAAEISYLLQLSVRLEFLPRAEIVPLADRYDRVSRALNGLIAHLAATPNTTKAPSAAPATDAHSRLFPKVQSPKSKAQPTR